MSNMEDGKSIKIQSKNAEKKKQTHYYPKLLSIAQGAIPELRHNNNVSGLIQFSTAPTVWRKTSIIKHLLFPYS